MRYDNFYCSVDHERGDAKVMRMVIVIGGKSGLEMMHGIRD
jgi:hypothetical protein